MKALRLALVLLCSVLAFAGDVFFGGAQPHSREPVTVVAYTAYTVGYSETRKVPLWSVYTVEHTAAEPMEVSRKGFTFFTEKATRAQVATRDYTHSGYARGHMTPFAAIAYAFGEEASRETFSMANIVPQLQRHNARIWAQLEEAVSGTRTAAGFHPGLTRAAAHIWVYTGPVLDGEGSGTVISDKEIAVPTALWKAAIWITPAGETRACAWIIPHEEGLDPKTYMTYATTLKAVEERAGVTLVPEDPGHVMDRCDAKDVAEAQP